DNCSKRLRNGIMNATCRGNISKSLSIKSSAVPPLMTIGNQAFRHCRCIRGEAHVECHSRWRHEVGSVISMLWVKSQSLRQENLRLKNQIQALSKEAEQMKLLLQQSSMQFAGEPPTDTNATPSREGVR
ncbi:unnamed protein product, partial [Porites evermanni]